MSGKEQDGGAPGRVVRLAERTRAEIRFFLDGRVRTALAGDTVLAAILASVGALRDTDCGPGRSVPASA